MVGQIAKHEFIASKLIQLTIVQHPLLKKQLNITSLGDVRKLAEAYVGIDDKLDVPGFVKAVSDIPLNRFKELYENEILRITNIDIRETKRKETAASEAEEEAKRVEAEKKEEQAKKDVETAKKAVDTRIESMPAKPLADVIEDVVDIVEKILQQRQ